MSLSEDRKNFFQMASDVGMVDDLALFAKFFGRFQAAKIELADGRSASYEIPRNVRLTPIDPPLHFKSTSNENPKNEKTCNVPLNDYARARVK